MSKTAIHPGYSRLVGHLRALATDGVSPLLAHGVLQKRQGLCTIPAPMVEQGHTARTLDNRPVLPHTAQRAGAGLRSC
ncbi:hypothetical protein GOB86_08835 [Acetobacter lambici]|uniref:Transposase n=1 Tax=Acetobacter lambici TaxID=1332824 RepID=A0ABT1F1J9_9PROT|nr:hypothetical protein [Acetobacter lambici]MCP1242655.1 hypothetical protein [Acetobacter lambici]MCP1258856.1 hypothetical protein [Acetobacter lambici]NHO57164.1 hypothetical protein [Acetobacter lambici]